MVDPETQEIFDNLTSQLQDLKDLGDALVVENDEYDEKVKCVTTTIKDAIAAQNSKFGSSYGYGMSSGPRGGQRQRMVGYRSPSRRAPRARGTTAKRRRSPMMY